MLIYSKVFLAEHFLKALSADPNIAQYNNIIVGTNSTSSGNKNVVIGNDNMVLGNSNYVFSQEFQHSTPLDNSLVLDEWLIELLKKGYIPFSGAQAAIQNWQQP